MPSEIAIYVPVLILYYVVHCCWPESSVYPVQISFFLLTNCYIEVWKIMLLWTCGKVLYKQVCKPEYPGQTYHNVGNPYPHNYGSVLKMTCCRAVCKLWNKNYTTDVFSVSDLTYSYHTHCFGEDSPWYHLLVPLCRPQFLFAFTCQP